MLSSKKLLMAISLLFGLAIASCSQPHRQEAPPVITNVFAGSTSCDKLILSTLGIPAGATCVFMKWELTLVGIEPSGEFKLTVAYGDYQPNTMNFLGGGTTLEISGRYASSYGTPFSPKRKVYHLTSDKIYAGIDLVAMDDNILHFADADKNLLVGDASFGYALNRIN